MEQGGLPLQDSLEYFEQELALFGAVNSRLPAPNKKVKILTEQQKLEPYQTHEN